ncbi:MAG TPA: asparagine synthase C-terminal domain-containing protein, partial [Burkholderiales bacterium]|nr:asparagine synthase C-terminal domain-containing protein [Burkholderiales bacterium]
KCSPEEASEALSSALTEAVRSRLPENGPVAAHLSGGLDSSAISVLASRMLREENRSLLAYSFLSKTEEAERPYVEMVLEQERYIVWNPVTIDDREAFFWPKMDSDQLFPLDISNPDIRVCSDVASQGANMLLSGWGGDQGATFNGRGVLVVALLRGRWRYLVSEIRALQETRGWSAFGVMKGELLRYLLPRSMWDGLRHLLGKDPGLADGASSLLRADFAGKASATGAIANPDACMNRFRMLTGPRLTRRVEEWAVMGSRYGLAVGFPMLDRRVVELAVSLPSRLFLREGWKRRVYRDAMKGILPEQIRLRHDKLRPFPEIDSFLYSERENLLARLAESCTHPCFDSLFDREEIGEAIRSADNTATVVSLKRIFNA